jgi:geranylgeranyl diphosphate synthase, type I
MFVKIKNEIEKELSRYIKGLDASHSLSSISPLLFKSISEFLLRKGKRVRPLLFMAGYRGFSKKNPAGLYRSAISLELLHNFMLVHDDIIDKSSSRRGKPSMHETLNRYIKRYKNLKFNGSDLTIIAGDVMYAMAMHAFLAIKEGSRRKENALLKLIEAALYTGSGEFLELLNGTKDIGRITKEDIYKIYDLKTANYTFASPLSIGAILAGAPPEEVKILFRYGIYLGRAFQIKDDIIGIFGRESETGKPNLTDLQEGKRTLIIWQAYQNTDNKGKAVIKSIFSKRRVTHKDLLQALQIIRESRALDYVKKDVEGLIKKAQDAIKPSKMDPLYKNSLNIYIRSILHL